MTRVTDEKVEKLLRSCGTELRLSSEAQARGAGADERDEAIARAARGLVIRDPKPSVGELIRAWLVPAQLAGICVLLLALVLRSTPGEAPAPLSGSGASSSSRGIVPASAVSSDLSDTDFSDTDLAAVEVDEAYANFFPQYEPLAIGSPDDEQQEDNDDDDEEFADI